MATIRALLLLPALLALSPPATGAEPASPHKRVVVLYSDAIGVPAVAQIDDALHQALVRSFGDAVEYDRDFLDLVHVTTPAYAETLTRFLQAKYEVRRPDLVVVVASNALRFLIERRGELFPAVPVLFCDVEPRELEGIELPPDWAGLVDTWNFGGLVDTALQLLPETRRLVVVRGTTAWEASVEEILRRELRPFVKRVDIESWSDLAMPELEGRVAALPRGAVLLYISLYRDAAGSAFVPRAALARLSAASNVPIFALPGTFLGQGIVGGPLIDFSAIGGQAGGIAARLLGGENITAIGLQKLDPGPPRFDGRQLRRWKISPERLPAASVVEFESPSLWQVYRWPTLGVVALFVIQSLLIAGLLLHRRRRRQAEEQLGRSAATSAAVIDSLHEGVAVLDPASRIVFANDKWLEFARATGATAELGLGASVLDASRQALERGEAGVRRSLAGIAQVLAGQRSRFELDYEAGSAAKQRSYKLTAVPLEKADGGAVVAIADVSDHRQAEERFRLIVESLSTAMVMVDEAGTIVMVNTQVEKSFGYLRNELLGQSIETLLPERFREQHPRLRGSFLARPEHRSMGVSRELFGLRKDGSEFPVEIGLSPIQGPPATLVLSSIVDISERRHAEAELQRLRAETAHFARVSTVGELSAAIAHELNQPLTGILSNAQAGQRFLEAGNADAQELQEILGDVVADGRRAGEVILRLRALLQKGTKELVRIDLNELVDQVVRVVAGDLALRSAALDLELAPDLGRIRGDRVQLQQVLLNLILNGIDAMEQCAPEQRRLLLRTAPAEGHEVLIQVRDAGTGISDAVHRRLFEPFFTTKAEGMGMGLSIVRSIVSSHGGRIWASNNAFGGATFNVALPAQPPDAAR